MIFFNFIYNPNQINLKSDLNLYYFHYYLFKFLNFMKMNP